MNYDEKPNYKLIYGKINAIQERLNITGNEPKVWDPYFSNNIFKNEPFWQLRVIEGASETPIDAQFIEDDDTQRSGSDEDKSSCRL